MKKIILLGLSILMTIFLVSCASTKKEVVCTIINETPYYFNIEVGQVLIKSNGNGYDWDSVGTPDNPKSNRNKFLRYTRIAPSKTKNIYKYPDEGFDFFIWGRTDDLKYVNGFGISKDSKLIHISILNGNLVIKN
jgi:hypothetical protein